VKVVMMVRETCEVIYQDEHLVAINKPSGMLVHRSVIDRHETRYALQLLRDQLGHYVYPVHRLDKPTSGVLLFGLSSDSARELSRQFVAGSVGKHYLAVVRGHCPQEGLVDHPLRDEPDRIVARNRGADSLARTAVTRYRRLATVELPIAVERYPQTRYSLVALRPETGRRHQLRRHLKHIGYPVIGDAKHGKGVHNRFFRAQYDCHRLLLACTAMTFDHPVSGRSLVLQAALDAPFLRVLDAFGWLGFPPTALQASAIAQGWGE
jgi:tRNA pseudouridine65 synthase